MVFVALIFILLILVILLVCTGTKEGATGGSGNSPYPHNSREGIKLRVIFEFVKKKQVEYTEKLKKEEEEGKKMVERKTNFFVKIGTIPASLRPLPLFKEKYDAYKREYSESIKKHREIVINIAKYRKILTDCVKIITRPDVIVTVPIDDIASSYLDIFDDNAETEELKEEIDEKYNQLLDDTFKTPEPLDPENVNKIITDAINNRNTSKNMPNRHVAIIHVTHKVISNQINRIRPIISDPSIVKTYKKEAMDAISGRYRIYIQILAITAPIVNDNVKITEKLFNNVNSLLLSPPIRNDRDLIILSTDRWKVSFQIDKAKAGSKSFDGKHGSAIIAEIDKATAKYQNEVAAAEKATNEAIAAKQEAQQKAESAEEAIKEAQDELNSANDALAKAEEREIKATETINNLEKQASNYRKQLESLEKDKNVSSERLTEMIEKASETQAELDEAKAELEKAINNKADAIANVENKVQEEMQIKLEEERKKAEEEKARALAEQAEENERKLQQAVKEALDNANATGTGTETGTGNILDNDVIVPGTPDGFDPSMNGKNGNIKKRYTNGGAPININIINKITNNPHRNRSGFMNMMDDNDYMDSSISGGPEIDYSANNCEKYECVTPEFFKNDEGRDKYCEITNNNTYSNYKEYSCNRVYKYDNKVHRVSKLCGTCPGPYKLEKNEEEKGQDQNANDIAAAEYATEVENMNKQNAIDSVSDTNFTEIASENIDKTNEEWCKMGDGIYEVCNQPSRNQMPWDESWNMKAKHAYRKIERSDVVPYSR